MKFAKKKYWIYTIFENYFNSFNYLLLNYIYKNYKLSKRNCNSSFKSNYKFTRLLFLTENKTLF